MIVLVCGGRNFRDADAVWHALTAFNRKHIIIGIITGGAKGADEFAKRWAEENDLMTVTYPAKWASASRAAGPIRNQRMLDDGKPGAVIAFPGGRGTADMVRRAHKAGLPVWEPCAPPPGCGVVD